MDFTFFTKVFTEHLTLQINISYFSLLSAGWEGPWKMRKTGGTLAGEGRHGLHLKRDQFLQSDCGR